MSNNTEHVWCSHRYTGPGISSNMAVAHIKMVSGWAVYEDSLKSLLQDRRVQLRRYDVDPDNGVQLYFNKVQLRYHHEGCVALRIYDYVHT